ncbi:MAG: site-2 protease family protein [Actinomycetales bacterium]|nr:site-2 protease family protein [Actinomycetales bacterium]
MLFVVGIVVFVLGLLVSIALHEVGHMVPAKRFGVRVSQYMVGFGPTLWSRTRGETEYGLKAVPLGGYVRLIGMYPTAEAVDAKPRVGRLAELVESAREASAAEIRPGEDHRAFYRLSAPKKLIVMLGGPVMNLVLAFVLLAIAFSGIGIVGATTTVGALSECVVLTTTTECGPGDAAAPAKASGMALGDEIVTFDGQDVAGWTELTELIRDAGGRTVPVVVQRGGAEVTLDVPLALVERAVLDGAGQPVLDAAGEPVTQSTGFLGVTPTAELQRQSLTEVPGVFATATWETVKVVFTLPVKLVDLVRVTFGGGERDASSIIGIVGVGRIAGEAASVQVDGVGLAERVAALLSLLASLNLALFAFNLIPLVPLDGGHVVGALWEGAKRQLARARGLATPRPADTARMAPLAYAVFVVLAGMGLLLIYADLVRPVSLSG